MNFRPLDAIPSHYQIWIIIMYYYNASWLKYPQNNESQGVDR